MSWDNVYSWSQALAVLFAVVALISGFTVNKRQGKTILELQTAANDSKAAQQRVETDLATAQKALAESQLKLEEVRKKQEPRKIDQGFMDALKDKPSAKLEILYPPDDGEAFKFALNIFLNLPPSWKSGSYPRAINESDGISSVKKAPLSDSLRGPPAFRVGGQPTGVSIVGNTWLDGHMSISPVKPDTPYGALVNAFGQCGIFVGPGSKDDDLPDGMFRIVIGARP